MSIVSNHFPEVIDQVNLAEQEGERPAAWDNSCFNLAYLPAQFACSANP